MITMVHGWDQVRHVILFGSHNELAPGSSPEVSYRPSPEFSLELFKLRPQVQRPIFLLLEIKNI